MSQNSSRPAALITGGTSGIGLATARILHEQGFAVLVTGQNPETIAEAQRSLPGEVAVLRADARILADAGGCQFPLCAGGDRRPGARDRRDTRKPSTP